MQGWAAQLLGHVQQQVVMLAAHEACSSNSSSSVRGVLQQPQHQGWQDPRVLKA
jgi:hypothetical protein